MVTNQLNSMELNEDGWSYWDRGYWIGGTCEGGKYNWYWADGTNVVYTNWYVTMLRNCATHEPSYSKNSSRIVVYGFDAHGTCTNVLGTWGGTEDGYDKKNWICVRDIDDCASMPCANGGTCTDGVASFTCACVNGYTGTNCETDIDDCASMPCANGGTCTDGVASYTCACVNGYTGTNCETDIDDCDSMPCANGGTCTDGVNQFTCQCINGYTGDICETDIDECSVSPCANNGTCTDGVYSYYCLCVAGYTGTNCETDMNECATNPCNNGGTCLDEINSYTCYCMDGYIGDTCQTDLCKPNPCQNDGRCIRCNGNFTCDCKPAYIGELCEKANFEGNDFNNNLLHVNYETNDFSSFSGSSDLCKSNKQAGLVIIRDKQAQEVIENQTISMYGGIEVQLWIGATKTEEGWFWLDGSHMTFQYWNETGSDVIGSCLKMISQSGSEELRWVPGDCDETMGYICEQPNTLLDPCEVMECYNSGSCTSSGAHYHCQCVDGYMGEDCATKISDETTVRFSTELIIFIALCCVIGFLLLLVIATVVFFMRRQHNVNKKNEQHCNCDKSYKNDVVYECIEDLVIDHSIDKTKLWETCEELSLNSNAGYILQYGEMTKKLDFSEKVDSDEMLKIPIQPISGEYVNEGNPQVFIAGQVKCFVKFWEEIMTQQCRVIVGFPETRTQFYPRVKRSKTYGNVKVSTLEKKHFEYFSFIILEALSQTNEYESISRKIFLFEFKNWADYDVISTSSRFVWFVNKVTENTTKISDGSSVIVYGRYVVL
ncbi:uncharacterized protein LOC101242992 isoform X2 [Ciona intestinalis]